jgi:hypothetical protein
MVQIGIAETGGFYEVVAEQDCSEPKDLRKMECAGPDVAEGPFSKGVRNVS